MTLPYIGFSNETLNRLPRVNVGDVVAMPCGHEHALEGQEALMFYRCGSGLFLAAVNGRLTVGTPADVKGSMPTNDEEEGIAPTDTERGDGG